MGYGMKKSYGKTKPKKKKTAKKRK